MESRKVLLYICLMETKSIKIPVMVHRELKVYVAHNPEDNMIEFAGLAIMKELSHRGHKFVIKIKSKITNVK